MRDRLTALVGALLSAALLYGVLVPQRLPEPLAARPTSVEPAGNGQLGAWRWLGQAGVQTYSLRERYDVLNREAHPAFGPGNLMISVMPQLRHARRDEIEELRDWVEAGNTLVLLAALGDTPGWSYRGDARFMKADVAAITGVEFAPAPPPAKAEGSAAAARDADPEDARTAPAIPVNERQPLDEPLWHAIEVDARHWLTAGIGTLSARSDLPTQGWVAAEVEEASLFEIGRAADGGHGVLWLISRGSGQVVLSSFGTLFQNDVIGRGGNRALLANLVRSHLGPGGIVIFDDMHQGLSTLYDPDAFFGDPRLHRSVLFAVALWLVFAVFANGRLGGVTRHDDPRRQADFVRATGSFLARKVTAADAGRRLLANFLATAGARFGAPAADPRLWEMLASSPLVDPALVARLRSRSAALGQGRRVDLAALHADIVQLRKALH